MFETVHDDSLSQLITDEDDVDLGGGIRRDLKQITRIETTSSYLADDDSYNLGIILE